MAILMISAKPAFLPAPDDLGDWTLHGSSPEFYSLRLGGHTLYATECVEDTSLRQRLKHAALAAFVLAVQALETDAAPDDFYLIAHDKDLLGSAGNDEGIYPHAGLELHAGGLESLIPAGHVYAFQHVPRQDMFETLISRLFDGVTEADASRALELINNCEYETPLG